MSIWSIIALVFLSVIVPIGALFVGVIAGVAETKEDNKIALILVIIVIGVSITLADLVIIL